MDPLVSKAEAELLTTCLIGGTQNEVDHLDRGVDDSEAGGLSGEGLLEEILVEPVDDRLPTRRALDR